MIVSDNWNTLWNAGRGQVGEVHSWQEAKVVQRKERATDSWGEPIQGEDEVYMIVQVGERFYRVSGTQDSYGYNDPSWGDVDEVFPKKKTVTVWE